MTRQFPLCYEKSRPCFAKTSDGKCRCLYITGFGDGKCPFCKQYSDVTDGEVYPFDDSYGKGYKKLKVF